MAPFRATPYLRCFYCGRSSNIRYDGLIRDFLCLHCDATNYLDENGDITDPPVATTASNREPTQYAFQRSTSPETQAASNAIFCDTCLKNQKFYTSLLAQYFPDDPDHPEYPQLERKYYKYRADLEERYPQICDECEPRVLGKLNNAGYIAKTDYLRRIMERNRSKKVSPRRRTLMGLADGVGRWLWWGSLILQLLWHARAGLELMANDLPLGEEGGYLPVILATSECITRFLPSTEWLMRLSLQATVLGIWWNPKLPQIVRGFSRPVLGLPKWYAFQALLVVSRYLFPRLVQLEVDHSEEMSAQFAIHTFMAGLVSYVYVLAGRSVRMDTTPLFAPADISTLRPKESRSSQGVKHEKGTSSQNLSEVLDDILKPPSRNNVAAVNDSPVSTPLPPVPRLNTQSPPQPQYPDEMEWSPIESPPPAFKDFGPMKPQPFGHPPSHEDQPQRPFWARVPAAPKAPAHKLYNPAPPAAEAIKQDRQHFTARFGGTKPQSVGGSKGSSVDFKQPSFFPSAGADPRSGLADMLGSSFSLGQERERPPSQETKNSKNNPFSPRKPPPTRPNGGSLPSTQSIQAVDAAFLVAILGLWIYAVQSPGSVSSQMMKASLAMSALHIARIAVGTLRQGLLMGTAVGLVLCAVELGAVGHVASRMWLGDGSCKEGCFEEGLWTMVGMLAHHLWDVLG